MIRKYGGYGQQNTQGMIEDYKWEARKGEAGRGRGEGDGGGELLKHMG